MLAFGADHPVRPSGAGLHAHGRADHARDLAASTSALEAGSSALVFVGDISLQGGDGAGDAALRLVDRRRRAAVTIPAPQPAPGGRSTSSTARTPRRPWSAVPAGAGAHVADYDALMLADAVWGGGGFGTRLNLNLREDKGYSYGVFSNLA